MKFGCYTKRFDGRNSENGFWLVIHFANESLTADVAPPSQTPCITGNRCERTLTCYATRPSPLPYAPSITITAKATVESKCTLQPLQTDSNTANFCHRFAMNCRYFPLQSTSRVNVARDSRLGLVQAFAMHNPCFVTVLGRGGSVFRSTTSKKPSDSKISIRAMIFVFFGLARPFLPIHLRS
jgi:hypothetical protein